MIRSYLVLAARHPRALAFGALLLALSSFGQTFFVALYGDQIRAAYGVGEGTFGIVYGAATLASGVLLGWVGRLIDRVSLARYALGSAALFAAACVALAIGSSVAVLCLALFGLRLGGQGLMVHIALTAIARRFAAERGRALGLVALGLSLGEAALPSVAVALDPAIDWRLVWIACGGLILAGTAGAVRWLAPALGTPTASPATVDAVAPVSGAAVAGGAMAGMAVAGGAASAPDGPSLARDPRFLLAMPAIMAPSFIVTGLFFHQIHLAGAQGWDLEWVAAAFVGFAVARSAALLLAGAMIDRIGSARLLPTFLLPLGLGLVAVVLVGHPAVALVYFVTAGITSGVSSTLSTALWTEVYGLARLGAVRATAAAANVVASALAPAMMGALIALGVAIDAQVLGCAAYAFLGSLLAVAAARRIAAAGPDR